MEQFKINETAADNRKKLVIGLFGFGTVGKGIYEVLEKTSSFDVSIKRICIRHPEKKRSIPASFFTVNAAELYEDNEINVIVEVTDDAEAAFSILKTSLEKGKAFVTANKKMLSENLPEIIRLQHEYRVPVLYEAACCASIPVIRNLEEYYDNDLLLSLRGIINGSTNYILTGIYEKNISYVQALLEAKQLGFAESDPSLDVSGRDAANKLSLLLAHGFGNVIKPGEFLYHGIENINAADIRYAKSNNFRIRLVAHAQKIPGNRYAAFVLPQFVNTNDELYHVTDEFNGINLESCFADKHFLKGKGAGSIPTASAILSDLSALRYDYRYEYKKCRQKLQHRFTQDCNIKVYLGASSIEDIPFEKFSEIEEQHAGQGEGWVIGIISISELLRNKWWCENEFSLVACPQPFETNSTAKKIRKLSLELAGV